MKRDEMIAELRGFTARLMEVQKARTLTDKQLVDEFPDLGSAKTWRVRLIGEKWEEMNLPRMCARALRIATILDGGTPDETFHAELPFAREMAARLTLLERQQTDRRILVCLAPPGTGKSAFTRWAVNQSRARRACLRLLPTKRNKPLHIYRAIGKACGVPIDTTNVSDAEDQVISMLQGQRRTVFLDQAHEGGVALMHIIRALVDETQSAFVYLAYNTAYKNVLNGSTDALVEAKAFVSRAIRPVFDLYASGTRAEDVLFYLMRDAGLGKGAAEGIVPAVLPVLQRHGNLRLLDDAITEARAATPNDEPEPQQIVAEVSRLSGEKIDTRSSREVEA